MSGLKRFEPALRFGQFGTTPPIGQITPDEIDRYEVYNIVGPGTAVAWYFLGTSGTADTTALVLLNRTPDYPRNIRFSITGSSAGEVGTTIINGKDQFGSPIQETITFNAASNGGTGQGTKIFAQVDSGTVYYGTFAGNGTARVGFTNLGTTTLFGLPVKLGTVVGGTNDVVQIGAVGGTDSISVNGGTLGGYVLVNRSAIQAPVTVTGTVSFQVWIKSTYNAENIGKVANLQAIT